MRESPSQTYNRAMGTSLRGRGVPPRRNRLGGCGRGVPGAEARTKGGGVAARDTVIGRHGIVRVIGDGVRVGRVAEGLRSMNDDPADLARLRHLGFRVPSTRPFGVQHRWPKILWYRASLAWTSRTKISRRDRPQ